MSNKLRAVLNVILISVLVFSVFMFTRKQIHNAVSEDHYDQALEIALGGSDNEPETDEPDDAATAKPAAVIVENNAFDAPIEAPTEAPTAEPTKAPTAEPTAEPTKASTAEPTAEPTKAPTAEPTPEPTKAPTAEPTPEPTKAPTAEPTPEPTAVPTPEPTAVPTAEPTPEPTPEPTKRVAWISETIEDDPVIEELEEIDLDALRKVNEDVIGWIRIPKTRVNYPIMQGEDNEHYLHHTWDGIWNYAGSIFMECQNSPTMSDYNTLIYGHNMKNGAMFATIREYMEQEYFDAHPYVYIKTDKGILRYEIFSSYQVSLAGAAYGLSFNQASTREQFLNEAISNSVIETGIVPEMQDRILTLSTCTSGNHAERWIVQARLKLIRVEY